MRDAPLSAAEEAKLEAKDNEEFEANLAANIEKLAAARKTANKPELDNGTAEMRLRQQRAARRAADQRLGLAERFRRAINALTVNIMEQSIQAMFDACDYSTKPSMTCAPLLVAARTASGAWRSGSASRKRRRRRRRSLWRGGPR